VPVTDGTQALALGSLVSGAIASPGQRQLYSFTLPSPARLYFDALTNNSNLRWSLDGPVGNVVNNRSFTSSDSISFGNPVLTLPPGSYTLTVSTAADNTGPYQFRVSDFAAATVLTPGAPVSVINFVANRSDLYRFTVAAGDQFGFNYSSASGIPNAIWRLIDPYDNVVFSKYFNGNAGTNVLGGGTYTLLLEGYIGDVGTGSYAFNVQPAGNVPPTNFTGASLVIGSTISGSLPSSSATSNYVFTLATTAKLYFDALVNANFNWSLVGPAGLVVNSRGFTSSDSADATDPLLNLPAGSYQLTITGAAGVYQFRLLDFTSATAFALGDIVNGSLAPGNSSVLYQFTGTAGQRVYFNGLGSSALNNQPYCRLYGPLANIQMAQYVNSDFDTFTLPQSGTYTLTVEGRLFETSPSGSFSFSLLPVSYPTNGLSLGTLVNGTIATRGQRQFYTFTLPTDATLYFDALTDANFIWRLDAPWGQIVNWTAFNASDGPDISDPALRLPAGSYTLAVAGNTFTVTGSYALRLLNFASAVPFIPGTVISNALSPADSTLLYQFNGTPGQKLALQTVLSSGFAYQPYFRIYSPTGNLLQNVYLNTFLDTFSLPQSGAYTLTLEGRVYDHNASGNYSFNLVPVTYPTNALTLGTIVNGTIATVGQRQFYTFTLPLDSILYFDALTDANFLWRLDAPRGQIVNWTAFNVSDGPDISDPALRLPAGSYTLAVAGNSFTTTGNYAFRLLNFANAVPFIPGTVISNALSPADSTLFYQFDGTTGQRLALQTVLSSGFAYQPYFRIYSPTGNLLQNVYLNTFLDTFSLPQSGAYTLTLEGRVYEHNASGNYSFNLVPVTYPTNALTLGTTVNATIATVGQRQFYTFTLPLDSILYFDALTDANFIWRLDAPRGQIVNWTAFNTSDGPDISDPVLRLPAGSYTLAVAGNTFTVTGSYAFRLLNFANAVPFTPGTIVAAPLNPANGTVLYRFTGSAGERYYFDGQPASGFDYIPYCRLYAPAGNILMAQYVNQDVDTFSLAQSGTYTLTVEGRVYDHNASGNYAFDLVPNPMVPPELLFPNVYYLEIAQSGGQYQIILHAPAGPSYTVQFTPALTPSPVWSAFWNGPVGSGPQVIPFTITNSQSFFRVKSP
jgi:hypothetical protein